MANAAILPAPPRREPTPPLMDPLAHTLFGATLAECGLKRRSRYATATLLLGANLPDVDVITGLWGGDFELHARRGWTHGVLAMLVLPLLLAVGIGLWHRWRAGLATTTSLAMGQVATGAAASGVAVPFHPRVILLLSFLAVWSHPSLDWLNTYGVRLLMPFDGRWFYGDTLFIIEPWFWLLLAAGVVMARSSTWHSVTGWSVLGLLTSALVLTTELVPLWVKVAWCAGVVLIALLRWRRGSGLPADTLARISVSLILFYVATAYVLARQAESRAAARFAPVQEVQANPAPADPFSRRLVVVQGDVYRIVAADGEVHEVARAQPDAIAQAALGDASIRGFANWLRYPYWTIEERGDHWLVHIRDLRYQGPDVINPRGIGAASVVVPKAAANPD